MDPVIGWERAQQPRPENAEIQAPTPEGYSLEVLLQLRLIDYVKELIRVMPAIFGGRLPPPMRPEPRPMTAEDRIREELETQQVYDAVNALLGIKS
ncbi:hypothetical protein [Nocardia asiatica]|uniref:hypothetical protein n=1 Tax=Nocardia asiatica TaxID=209252 RepID=UPI00245692FC|nr:hypothetical protein [Nocardia asiatica]